MTKETAFIDSWKFKKVILFCFNYFLDLLPSFSDLNFFVHSPNTLYMWFLTILFYQSKQHKRFSKLIYSCRVDNKTLN